MRQQDMMSLGTKGTSTYVLIQTDVSTLLCGVSTCNNLVVIQEPATWKEPFIAQELSTDFGHSTGVPVIDVVDGQHVVHSSTSNQVSRGWENGGHHPSGSKWNDLQQIMAREITIIVLLCVNEIRSNAWYRSGNCIYRMKASIDGTFSRYRGIV